MKTTILAVDDEPEVLDLVTFNLEQAGFKVVTARDGTAGLRKARSVRPALILLDIMLPQLNGLEVLRLLHQDPASAGIPVILLTARASEMDRVVGLELGAEDYITKPFSTREMVLRVRKAIERVESRKQRETIVFGPLVIDVAGHFVTNNGKPIDLTLTEFKLLELLTQAAPRVQSRDQLLREVWGYSERVNTRTVDTHMRRLRKKLGPAACHLDTVRGIGYRFLPVEQ